MSAAPWAAAGRQQLFVELISPHLKLLIDDFIHES